MRKFLVITGLVAGLTSANFAAAEDVKIGTVDMQKALQTVEAGKRAKEKLEKEFNAKKKVLETEKSSIDKLGEEFKKQSMVLNDEARGKKENEIRERIVKFQDLTQRSQMEIQQRERELTLPIIEKLRETINTLAKAKGYTVVLEKNENSVLYSLEKDDLTQEVINTFNKSNKDNKG